MTDLEDSLQRDISTKGVPAATMNANPTMQSHSQLKNATPLMFDFEHNRDPSLTPRREWQQKVQLLENKIEDFTKKANQERDVFREEKFELEKQILALDTKLKESERAVFAVQTQHDQEVALKEEYHKQAKRAQFDLERLQVSYKDSQKIHE